MVFALPKMGQDKAFSRPVPVPGLKPASKISPRANKPPVHLDLSASADAGQYRRLRVDQFLTAVTQRPQRAAIEGSTPKLAGLAILKPHASKTSPQFLPAETDSIAKPLKITRRRPSETSAELTRLYLNNNTLAFADEANDSLPYLPEINEYRFIDRVVDMAEASPIQPDSRRCGPLNHSLDVTPKYNKVRSVGMERQITGRTSIGVEFVYKDGCYKKAIAPLKSANMPGDDGVNLRVNMRF